VRKRIVGALGAVVLFVLAAPALSFGQAAPAQPSLQSLLHKIVVAQTQDLSEFVGELVALDSDRVQLVSPSGVILMIARDRLKSIHEADPVQLQTLQIQDAASTTLLTVPTAFPMRPGSLLVSDTELVGVTASYGLTRYLSLWGGATFTGTALNVRLAADLAQGFVGVSAGSFVGVNWFGSLTDLIIPYASASFGSVKANVTVGLGGVLTLDTSLPLGVDLAAFAVVLGGRLPLFPSVALVTENWLILPYDPFLGTITDSMTVVAAAAVRFEGSRLSLDVGLALPFTMDPTGIQGAFGFFTSVFPVPLLGATYRIY